MKLDLGTLATLEAEEIDTEYVACAQVEAGRPDKIRYTLALTLDGASSITGLKVTAQASPDLDEQWQDIKSENDADPVVGAADIEHTFVTSVGTTNLISLVISGGHRGVRLRVKATGAAGGVGDSLVITGFAL